MPSYTIEAHQEMYSEVVIRADNAVEALAHFNTMMRDGKILWRPSDEELDAKVCDAAGEVVLTVG